MASILDRYGIKEVADVTFYEIGSTGMPTNPVLYLDTLKVSTIEQTAEESTANGGKGNAPLIVWDFGKEINVTLEDALFSAKSLAIMFGNGTVATFGTESTTADTTGLIMRTERFIATGNASATLAAATSAGWSSQYVGPDGKAYPKINPKFYNAEGASVTTLVKDTSYFCSYDLSAFGSVIEISANSFPGTYYVTGDTYARSETTGKDEFFQFIIPKAKVQSENTITMEAEGDPSVFNMSLRVLRPVDGKMMKLVQYTLNAGADVAAADLVMTHNHILNPQTTT